MVENFGERKECARRKGEKEREKGMCTQNVHAERARKVENFGGRRSFDRELRREKVIWSRTSAKTTKGLLQRAFGGQVQELISTHDLHFEAGHDLQL